MHSGTPYLHKSTLADYRHLRTERGCILVFAIFRRWNESRLFLELFELLHPISTLLRVAPDSWPVPPLRQRARDDFDDVFRWVSRFREFNILLSKVVRQGLDTTKVNGLSALADIARNSSDVQYSRFHLWQEAGVDRIRQTMLHLADE